ncbi:LytR family transcriptional regulator [Microbacterium protaetiae]|uniref:LytR family transcriptional regulator n=1 Tax=Microbacterium protaetiae TaxID=2509458 RepID=A0A4P6EH91_9MICO|nr:LCP family protein [Microbacterium protaetiae]QAY61832.1 LytR family transcriptional regulator [Microbacterium protaetiae]
MTRRGWWLVVCNFLIPGSAQALAGNRRLAKIGLGATLVMWVLVIIGIVSALLWRTTLLKVVLADFSFFGLFRISSPVLLLIGLALFAYLVLWVVLTVDTLRLVRLIKTGPTARFGIALLSIVLLVLSGTFTAGAASRVFSLHGGLASIFQASAPMAKPSDGYYNILLLGADSGSGRDSMRFDSISVVSVNADTGQVTITGIPRDLEGFPFSADSPMRQFYPDLHTGHGDPTCGWTAAINQLNTELEVCRDGNAIYPDAEKNGSTPGVEATKDAAEGLLGIDIPYYAFIDMAGFADLVDALGGVDITVTERLPEGGGPKYEGQPTDEWATGWIEKGKQHMDGNTAQWYARSRKTTSDWDRMKRQRQLQEAILKQFTPVTVLSRFQEIMSAGEHLVKTDIPKSMLSGFADLAIKAKEHKITTIELTPQENNIDQTSPDIDAVHALVHDALHPASESPSPKG